MPIVPRYDSPQVENRAITPVMATADTSVSAATQKLGQQIESTGSQFQEMIQTERAKEASTALKQAKLDLLQQTSMALNGDGQTPGLLMTQGNDAKGLEQSYRNVHDKALLDQLDKLKDYPEAQTLLEQYGQEHYVTNSVALNKHEYTEKHTTAIKTNEAMVDADAEDMLQKYKAGQEVDPFNPDGEMAKSADNLRSLYGWTVEQKNEYLAQKQSKLLASMLEDDLVKGDIESAKSIRDNFGEFIRSTDDRGLAILDGKIRAAEDEKIGNESGEAAFISMKPQNIDQKLDMVSIRDSIEKSDLTPERKKIAIDRAVSLGHQYEADKRANEEANSNYINKLYQDGNNYATIKKAIKDSGVDSAAKGNFYDWLDHKFKVNEIAAEGRAEARALDRERRAVLQAVEMYKLMDKQSKGEINLKPEDALKYITTLGSKTSDFANYLHNYQNTPAAKVQEEQLKDIITKVKSTDSKGLYKDVFPSFDKSESSQAKMALLQMEVFSLMAAAKAGNHPLTLESAVKMAVEKVDTNARHGFMKGFAQSEPMYLLNTKYATKYGRNPSRWSEEAKAKYIRRMYAIKYPTGKPLTDDEVQRAAFALSDVEVIQ